jgi:hypothetical protein
VGDPSGAGRAAPYAQGAALCCGVIAGLLSFSAVVAADPVTTLEEPEVCSSRFPAYGGDTKLPKGQRLAERERAEERAFLDLAQQAFATGSYHERMETERRVQGDSAHPDDGGFDEDTRLVQAGRKYYGVNELLHGGTYHREGDDNTLSVWYCLPAEQFEAARAGLRRERDADVARIRARLRGLEQGVTRDELAWATEEMSSLLGEVQSRVMETETYVSPLTGEEKTFRGWLTQWRTEVQRGSDYAMQIIEEASRKVKEGHLVIADGLLDEAVEADPTNPRARQVRLEIEDRRKERADLLKSALDKAAVGKFAAAQRDLDRAEQIDADDARRLHSAAQAVQSRKTEFFYNNPRARGDLYVAFGGLGADVGGASQAYESATAEFANPTTLTTVGLSCRVRLGRFGQFVGSGGYGFSDFTGSADSAGADSVYHYGELLAGLGFRTIRTSTRPVSLIALGGVTREFVSIDISAPGLDASDARTGSFARIGAEWSMLTFYVQQGFGFTDPGDPEGSLVRWHNGTQFAVAISY